MFKQLIYSATIVVASTVFLASCGSNKKETPSGLAYEIIKKGSGSSVAFDEFMAFEMKIYDKGDSLLYDFNEDLGPLIVKFDSSWFERGQFFELLPDLSLNDSIIFSIGNVEFFNTGFAAMSPPHLDATDNLNIQMRVFKIMNESEFNVYSEALTAKAIAAEEERMKESILKEAVVLDAYLAEKNIEAETTESGLRYVITKKGNGKKAEANMQVHVNYTGMLLDGTVFDTSVKSVAEANGVFNPARNYEPFTFTLGQGMVIRGWDEGIALLEEGDKATLFIPSGLAYGERGSGNVIPPNSPLMFEVELVEAK